MKLVIWTRDTVPHDFEADDNGDYLFEDHPCWFDLEVGDQIQYMSFLPGGGVRCFFVQNVVSIYDGVHNSPTRRLVFVTE